MFKHLFAGLIVLLYFFSGAQGGSTHPFAYTAVDEEKEITEVVKGGVEDTRWLTGASREDIYSILSAYYTEPLLTELSDAAWSFSREPTDWETIIRLKRCEVLQRTRNEARVSVEILEEDALTGEASSYRAEYFLEKSEMGWRISYFASFYTPSQPAP